MATVYSEQYKLAYEDVPGGKVAPGDDHGRLRVKHFSYTAAGVIALNDIIKLCRLPAGARVHDFVLDSPDLGTGGDFDAGWAASADAVEAADADGFLDGADVNAAAIVHKMTDFPGLTGQFKKFDAEVDIQVVAVEATTAGGTILGAVYYTTD